jgi:tRNA dimethylallyltransferase
MLPSPFQDALVLTGPTGSGKTQLGIELAQRLDAEIISMDSMALYRRMDIGTAKPTQAQRALAPHHLVDVLEPWESATVAWWLEQAKRCTREIEARGKLVLFVGGTPLYLMALISGLFDGPPANEAIRRRLTLEAQTLGSEALHQRLAGVDPVSAERIHPNDVRRMVRALEVYELTGKTISAWQTQWSVVRGLQSVGRSQETAPLTPTPLPPTGRGVGVRGFGDILSQDDADLPRTSDCEPAGLSLRLPTILRLDLSRDDLYDRINRRVEEMFAVGLVEEARQLRALERPLSLEASQALGYKDIFDFLNGRITRDEAIVRVQTRSRNFAKRQIAWFRHLPECRPVTIELTWKLWQPKMNK